MTRVLVAGATGSLGRLDFRRFRSRGYNVCALVRPTLDLDGLWDARNEVVESRITRPEMLQHVRDSLYAAFSSPGISRHKDAPTIRSIDRWAGCRTTQRRRHRRHQPRKGAHGQC